MKLVEGQLDFLRMYRDMSTVSDSFSSTAMRKYINSLERAIEMGFGDIVPRTIEVKPLVDKDGTTTSNWITPEADSGRIVSKSS